MTPRAAKLQGEVVRRWLEQARGGGESSEKPGKRSWQRNRWLAPLLIQVKGGTARRIVPAVSRDVCSAGIGAFCQTRLAPDTPVHVWVDGQEHGVTGQVMHATRSPHGWYLGIAFSAAE